VGKEAIAFLVGRWAIAILFLDKRSLFYWAVGDRLWFRNRVSFWNSRSGGKNNGEPGSLLVGKKAIAYWLNSLCPSCLCGSILKKLSWRSLFYFWI